MLKIVAFVLIIISAFMLLKKSETGKLNAKAVVLSVAAMIVYLIDWLVLGN